MALLKPMQRFFAEKKKQTWQAEKVGLSKLVILPWWKEEKAKAIFLQALGSPQTPLKLNTSGQLI